MTREEKRVVFLMHDGVGFGHLQRTCKLVRALQGVFSCLVVTGERAASWLVPAASEFVHLPNIDSLVEHRARRLGRYPFVVGDEERAIAFRRTMIEHVVASFDPDALVVDYQPLGYGNELERMLRSSRARKYLLLRGVLDTPDQTRQKFLEGPALDALTTIYDRIFVAADRRICSLAEEYGMPATVSGKLAYVGYVSTPYPDGQAVALRAERGLPSGQPWVVCSVGRGRSGRALIRACEALPDLIPEAAFDFIHGPDGLPAGWGALAADYHISGNGRHFKECRYLPALHASADVVVTHGGYNSLVEGMEGGARIISCYAPPGGSLDYLEERIHPERLSRYYPLRLVDGVDGLEDAVREAAAAAMSETRPRTREILDFNGTANIRATLMADLGVDPVFAAKRAQREKHPPGHAATNTRQQKRLVFFVHDGSGLGHLHRTCKLIRSLQGIFSCLVVTGHRAASWLVPDYAEFVRVPHIDSLIESRSLKRGRYPFVSASDEAAIRLRQSIVDATLRAFEPDAILVDYHPLGYRNELEPVLRNWDTLKYLVLRGVLESVEQTRSEFLEGLAGEALANWYHRILVATDRRICDVASEYGMPPQVAAKLTYVGYVSSPLKPGERERTRAERNVTNGTPWIVCSVGNGRNSRSLVGPCTELAASMSDAYFDVIHGSDSSHGCWQGRVADFFVEGNIRYFKECRYLSRLHGSADVVVTHGGYNALVEAMEGGARIVSCYAHGADSDAYAEQRIHPERLAQFYPVRSLTSFQELPAAVTEMAREACAEQRPDVRSILDFNGPESVLQVLMEDLDVDRDFAAKVARIKSQRAEAAGPACSIAGVHRD